MGQTEQSQYLAHTCLGWRTPSWVLVEKIFTEVNELPSFCAKKVQRHKFQKKIILILNTAVAENKQVARHKFPQLLCLNVFSLSLSLAAVDVPCAFENFSQIAFKSVFCKYLINATVWWHKFFFSIEGFFLFFF